MIVFFWLVLLVGIASVAWVLGIKARGSFYHWVRPFRTEPCQVVGRTFPAGTPDEEMSSFLVDANAFVRSKEQRSTVVLREWDHAAKTIFVGLVLQKVTDLGEHEGYEVRALPSSSVLRASGSARTSDITPTESLQRFLEKCGQTVDMTRPMRLSGQSFHLYQWPLNEELPPASPLQKMMEKTFQLRDILIFPILLTIVALGLIGTQQLILFPIGIGLIILLSGAGKFVFLHQMKDESEEYHLQNY
ncbi:hypothetical protein [Roseibacillus ishigakijimensis]|uniref:Uncharacterized protein n=1 Tax=Roseibacillus ishigakijimensis TaxID=454146 RepID=A0A934RM20_9BACT|nr:hypothetical protein [Roseibacillus ishigakijimensis]MBK1833318.1 hypothetical protein [Roseibacillus ishigakijimensis]